jgi:hypothetical protein
MMLVHSTHRQPMKQVLLVKLQLTTFGSRTVAVPAVLPATQTGTPTPRLPLVNRLPAADIWRTLMVDNAAATTGAAAADPAAAVWRPHQLRVGHGRHQVGHDDGSRKVCSSVRHHGAHVVAITHVQVPVIWCGDGQRLLLRACCCCRGCNVATAACCCWAQPRSCIYALQATWYQRQIQSSVVQRAESELLTVSDDSRLLSQAGAAAVGCAAAAVCSPASLNRVADGCNSILRNINC